MKIMSLNVNNFGGDTEKPRWDKYTIKNEYWAELREFQNDPKRIEVAREITNMIRVELPDVVVFQEFDVNAPAGKQTINDLGEYGYLTIYPDKERPESIRGNCSITMMFTKKDNVERYRSPELKAWKWCGIKIDDLMIIGIHAPEEMKFLRNVQEWAKSHDEEKVIILGDFNITTNKCRIEEKKEDKAFLERVQWLLSTMPSIRYSDTIVGEPITYFNQKTTIDHVLVSPGLQGKTMTRVCSKEEHELSDHAVIIVNIEE